MTINYEDNRQMVHFRDIEPGEVFLDPDLDGEAVMRIGTSDLLHEEAADKENGDGFGIKLSDGEIFFFRGNDGVYRAESFLNVRKI